MWKLISVVVKVVALATIFGSFMGKKAHSFPYHAEVHFDPIVSVAVVNNYFGRPIVCSGRAQGLTSSGHFVYSYINSMPLYPGQYQEIYVYANNWNPFVSAQAFINCFYL